MTVTNSIPRLDGIAEDSRWRYLTRREKLRLALEASTYVHLRCHAALSFPDMLMEDEELMHKHWGLVVYTEACQALDQLDGERYRIRVELNGNIVKAPLHRLFRKAYTGEWYARMCHKNPNKEFIEKHFYPRNRQSP